MATAKKPPALPDREVQALADKALSAWTTGVPVEAVDELGAVWTFEPLREEASRLIVRRYVKDADGDDVLSGETQVAGFEFGVDDPRPLVTSRVLAVAST